MESRTVDLQAIMKREKLNSFAVIFLSCPLIITTLYVLCVLPKNVFCGKNHLIYYTDIQDIFVCGVLLGVTQTLIFAILEWFRKSESLLWIIPSTFVFIELLLILGFTYTFFHQAGVPYYEIKLWQFHIFTEIVGLDFVKDSLFVLLFSIVAGKGCQTLFIQAKNQSKML